MRGLRWNPKQVWAAARAQHAGKEKRNKEKARVSEQATQSVRVGNGRFRIQGTLSLTLPANRPPPPAIGKGCPRA